MECALAVSVIVGLTFVTIRVMAIGEPPHAAAAAADVPTANTDTPAAIADTSDAKADTVMVKTDAAPRVPETRTP